MQAPFQIELMRPNKVRFELEVQGMRMIQAFDGETGWQVMPLLGRPDPQVMTGEALQSIREQADVLDGPLIDWKAKGYGLELLGADEIDGNPVWKLAVTRGDGRRDLVFVDGEGFLERRTRGQRPIGGQSIQVTTDIGDYQPVTGLMLPHSVQVSLPEAPGFQSLRVAKIELDVDIDPIRSAMPER